MEHKREQSKLRGFISELMKGQLEEEIIEAEGQFISYLNLVRDIQHRMSSEKDRNA